MITDMSLESNATQAERALPAKDEEEDELFRPSPTQRSLRKLTEAAGGKWDEVNFLLGSLEFNIPAVEIEQELLGLVISASVNGSCSQVGVDDILLDWDKSVSEDDEVLLAYKIQVLGARLKCFLQVDWDTGVLDVSDNIKLKLELEDNSFGVALQLEGSPPSNSTFLGCKVQVNIGDIASSGGFSSDIINDLNYLIVGLVRNEAALISGTVCEILFGFTETINDLLVTVEDILSPFLVEYVPVDPLFLEDNLPADIGPLVSFLDTSGLGNIVNVLLTNLEGIITADQINVLITGFLLDEDGVFVFELAPTPTMAPTTEAEGAAAAAAAAAAHGRFLQADDDLVVMAATEPPFDPLAAVEGCIPDLTDLVPLRRRLSDAFGELVTDQTRRHLEGRFQEEVHRRLQLDAVDSILANLTLDDVINTTEVFQINEITPTKIEVVGLNTFTDVAPLAVIGDYTLMTQLALPALAVSAEVYIDIAVNNVPLQTLATIDVEVTGIALNTSYVVGLSQSEVDTWTIGTFLNTDNIVGCLIAALEVFGFSKLEFTVEAIGTPIVDGIISDAVSDLANTGVEAAICAYQDLFIEGIPGFVQNNVTLIVNEFAACYIASSNATCPEVTLGDIFGTPGDTEGDVVFDFRRNKNARQKSSNSRIPGFLDFRDLLLPPEQAAALGASGRQPYGDLLALAYGTLLDTAVTVDNATGAPGANEFLPEEVELDMDLIDFALDFSDIAIVNLLLKSASLYAHSARLQNINTLRPPLSFLEPTADAHVLTNIFNFGPAPQRSLGGYATLETALVGNNSGLATANALDTGGNVAEMDLVADFRVMISTMDFINFPIADILELNCWLALVQTPDAMDQGFEITRMVLDLVDLTIRAECLNCTSELLPGVINVLDDVGAMRLLGSRVGPLVEEMATSDVVPPLVTDLLGIGDRAARLCPHSPLYNTTPNATEIDLDVFSAIEIPPLTNGQVDSLVFAGILGAEVAAVLFAESHVDNDLELSDPLSGQQLMNISDDVNLLDWTRLNESFIPLADVGLDFVRDFLGPSDDGDLGVNGLVGETFNLTLDLALELLDGYEIVIEDVQLSGLESFKQFDILEPIAPQTLKNTIAMESLTFVVDFSMNVTNTSEPAIPYRVTFDVTDVNATVYLFTAIDMDKIEALELGQLLFIENLLPCFLGASLDVHVPAMRVSVGNISQPKVEGLMSDTSEVAEASLVAVFEAYSWIMVEATNSIFDHTVRIVVNDFVQGFIEDTSACLTSEEIYGTPSGPTAELIDFRDLLLPPEDAVVLGGSGDQPYGDVVSTAYALVLDQLASNGTGQLLELNSFIDDFSLSQSGENGTLLLEDELISFALDVADFGLPLNQTALIEAFNARIRNINTLVSPIALAHPTTHPYVLENMINFGPIEGKPLNATVGALLELEGELQSLDMYNKFDLSGEMTEVDMIAALSVHILRDNLMAFPIRDIFEISCWLSLLEHPNATDFEAGSSGFKFEQVLTKLADLSINSNCLNCTSRVLDNAISLVDEAGASETFGTRIGYLIEDIAMGDIIPTFLSDFGFEFGQEAGRSCPHHPLYNTSSAHLDDPDAADSGLTIPALSGMSVDTLLFAGVIFGEIAIVVGADNHLQNPGLPTDPLYHQKFLDIPEGVKLIDWQDMESVGIPFMAEALDFARDFLLVEDGGDDEGANGFIQGFTDANGTFQFDLDFGFEQAGILLTIKSVRADGLHFVTLDPLNPIAPQTFQNSFYMENIEATIDFSIEILESTDAPTNLSVTVAFESLNASIPLFAAVDEDKLAGLKLGQLLFLENALPCIVSTTYGVVVEDMNIQVGNMSEPVFEGFMPDTSESMERSTSAIWDEYGDMIEESIPLVFRDTVRVFINSFLSSFVDSDSACKTYPTNSSFHYIDFRQMFQPSNSTAYSPYGDIIPIARELLEEELLSVNPETQMPKINDVLIAPFTEDQSGVEGTLLLPGKIFGFDTEALSGFGISTVGVELFDARVENLDTVGEPLHLAEPNQTRPDLLDNGATFGTQFSPLRFAIRGTLSTVGPFFPTYDEMDVFGELRSAPIFAVLLARIGAEEFLNFPLGSTADANCWLGTLAAPALKEIQEGNMEVNPIIAMEYLNIAFQSMRISASCYNCTTGGLEVVPDLLEILETTTAKNVLGYRNVELILNLLNSDFAQVWMLRIFQDSIRQCDHSSNSTLGKIIVPNTDFPQLSDYHMETGVFTVTAMIQLGLVILAETIADLEGLEPLFSDPVSDIPPGTKIVDFTELDEIPVGALAVQMIDFMNDYLGAPTEDEDTGEISLGINSFLGNPIMPISEYAFDNEIDIGLANLKIKVLGGVLSGLDTFTRFAFANITGPTSMRHELGWERLQVDINFEIDLTGQPDSLIFMRDLQVDPNNDGLYQFSLTIEMADVLAVLDTFIALDYELMKYLELGQFLRFDKIPPCIQATVLELSVTDAIFQIGRVTKMEVSGFKSPDVQTAAENLEESLLEKYGDTIASMAPTVFSAGMRPLLNGFISDFLRESDAQCDEFPFDPSTEGFIDFRDLFLEPADSVALGGTGKGQYGDIISTFFGYSQLFIRFFLLPELADFSFPGAIFDQGIRFDVRQFKSVFVLKVSDLLITNPNSIGTLTYTQPVDQEPFVLDNEIKMGIGRKPLIITFRVFLAFKGLGEQLEGVDIADDFQVTISIKSIEIILQLLMRVSELDFVGLPLRNALNLNCWLAMIPPPELDEDGYRLPGAESNIIIQMFELAMKELAMEIECYNCTSPGLIQMNELLQQPGATDELTEEILLLIGNLTNMGGEFLQDQIDNFLSQAPYNCPHVETDPNAPRFKFNPSPVTATNDAVYLEYVLAIIIPLVLAAIIIIGVRTIVYKRHKKWIGGLPSERVFLIQQKQEKEEHREAEINEITTSMFESPQVPGFARYFVPFIVVVNIGFFLSGHLSLGGRAMVDITIAGEYFRVDNFYDFSIAQSTLDLWHAGGEELAALILLFSGIWPYTKQLITLALWFLPPSVVSVSRRGQFLLWLDLLAKWSMIDIFVLLITVAGFRLGGKSPDYSFLPVEFWDIQLIVVPMWGLYANMIAQLMSQISSHFIVMYHRRILRYGKEVYTERHHPTATKQQLAIEQQDVTTLLSPDVPEEEKKDQLCRHAFIRPHKAEEAKLVPRHVINGFLPICSVGLCVLLVFACIWPSLNLEAYGVIGLGIEFGNKFTVEAKRSESIFSKAKILVEQAKYLDELRHYIGNGFLAFLFLTTLLVVPIMSLGTLMFLWLVPTTRKQKNKCAIALEILQAWQYVEVYMLGIIIESWQLGSISKLFINRYCESVNPILDLIAAYGIIDARDAQCFELGASIAEGAYALIPFTMGLALVGTYVVKAYIQTLREQHDEEDCVTEEEKLRAFDRTTWDNRDSALENIHDPPVLFTDTFRWTLARKEGSGDGSAELTVSDEAMVIADKPLAAPTYPAAETSDSDDAASPIPPKVEETATLDMGERPYAEATLGSLDSKPSASIEGRNAVDL